MLLLLRPQGYIWMKIAGMQVNLEDYYDKDDGVGDADTEKKNKLDFITQLGAADPESIEDYGLTFEMEVVGNPGTTVNLVKDGGARGVDGSNWQEWCARISRACTTLLPT